LSAKTRLGLMMFLQYAIWGAWAPVLSSYLISELGFSGGQVGWIYALLPLATIISPFIGGQVADRYFSSEKVIAFLAFTGGVLLLVVSRTTDFSVMAVLMLVYCLLYAPTLALTNSIAMINLKDSEEEFGKIRVWGTLGWIAAGWVLTGWRWMAEDATLPVVQGDTLFLAGIISRKA
jgi:MFS family permease